MEALNYFMEGYRAGVELRKSRIGQVSFALKKKIVKNPIQKLGLEYGFEGNSSLLKEGVKKLLEEGIITDSDAFEMLEYVEQLPLLVKIARESIELIGNGVLLKLREAFFARGWIKWEKEASKLLNVPSMYETFESGVLAIVSSDNGSEIVVLYNGKEYAKVIPKKDEEGLTYEALVNLLKPRLIVVYGRKIPLEWEGKAVDFILLSKLALPMSPITNPKYLIEELYGRVAGEDDFHELLIELTLWILDNLANIVPHNLDLNLPLGVLLIPPPFKPKKTPVASKKYYTTKNMPPGVFVSPRIPEQISSNVIEVKEDILPLDMVFSPYGFILPELKNRNDPWENYLILQMYITSRKYGWWYDPLFLSRGLDNYNEYIVAYKRLIPEKLIYKKTCKNPPNRIVVAPWNLYPLLRLCGKKIASRHLVINTLINPYLVLHGGIGVTRDERAIVPNKLVKKKTGDCRRSVFLGDLNLCIDRWIYDELREIFPRIDIVSLPNLIPEEHAGINFEKEFSKEEVNIYGLTHYITSLHELMTALNSLLSKDTIIIVPSREMQFLVKRVLDDVNCISWNDLIENPNTVVLYRRIIIVNPEKILSNQFASTVYPMPRLKTYITGLLYNILRKIGAGKEIILVTRIKPYVLEEFFKVKTLKTQGNPIMVKGDDLKDVHSLLVDRANNIFKEFWGNYDKNIRLRPYQVRSISYALTMYTMGIPSVIITVLPTGAGKSAIYQVLGRLTNEAMFGLPTIVVSPLRALIHDQVKSLREKGFIAEYIDAGITSSRRKQIVELYGNNLIDFLYVTPERFEDPIIQELISPPSRPVLIVLDEVHTLSKWGRSFRPSYLHMAKRLLERNKVNPKIPLLGFTATLPPRVDKDVIDILTTDKSIEPLVIEFDLNDPYRIGEEMGWHQSRPLILKGPVIRKELKFDVEEALTVKERNYKLIHMVSSFERRFGSIKKPYIGVIYTGFVQSEENPWANVDSIVDLLNKKFGEGFSIGYHGGLNESKRNRIENIIFEASKTGKNPKAIVATKAFGMGIDIPNIRYVIHYMMSESIEDYYQEAGRAGRDGKISYIVSLYSSEDKSLRKRLMEMETLQPTMVLRTLNLLSEIHSWLSSSAKGLEIDPYTIVLPSIAFYPVTPVKIRGDRSAPTRIGEKILDLLSEHNILTYEVLIDDFHTVKGDYQVLEKYADSLYPLAPKLYLYKGRKIPYVEYEKVSYNAGPIDDNYVTIPLEIKCCGKTVFRSSSYTKPIKQQLLKGRTSYFIIRLNPEWTMRTLDILPYQVLDYMFRREQEDYVRLEYLDELLSKALDLKKRGKHPDKIIKQGIEEYFTSTIQEEEIELDEVRGSIKTCDKIEECILTSVSRLKRLLYRTGGNTRRVVLVTMGQKERDVVLKLYERSTGHNPPAWLSYSNLKKGFSRRGILYLMDKGYIVGLLPVQKYNEIDKIVEKYPYAYIYLYRG